MPAIHRQACGVCITYLTSQAVSPTVRSFTLNKPLWRDTATPAPKCSQLDADVSVDVVVVGAGFTGLRAALALAEAGTKVLVVDSHQIGFGASGRSGGQVNPMLPVARPEDLRSAVGDVYFERMAEVSLQSADQLFELVKQHDIDCDARQKGWLRTDHCASARNNARAAAKAWNAFGAGFEFVDGDDVRRLSGSPAYSSAVLSPKGGAVHPLSLIHGLARAAMDAGATIAENCEVSSMRRASEGWVLAAGGHEIKTQWIVVATNGYTGRLVSGLRRSILPLSPVQIATDELDEGQIGEILPDGHTISDTRRLIMYARREPGNRLVFGGIGFRWPTGRIGGFRWLLQDAERVFPTLRGVNWRHRWSGQIALTDDRVPHLHEPEPGLIAGLGYNGRGVAMSLVIGRLMAERVLGKAADALPIPITKIESMAFRDTQVFGAGLAMSLMRMRDRLEFR